MKLPYTVAGPLKLFTLFPILPIGHLLLLFNYFKSTTAHFSCQYVKSKLVKLNSNTIKWLMSFPIHLVMLSLIEEQPLLFVGLSFVHQ
jgi:hypothetical protein